MVLLPEGYCIDSTEVTRAQYHAWLDTQPSTEGQSYRCTWNESFEPNEPCSYYLDGKACGPDDCLDGPQNCVDWCDANSYCEAMGKRLCGKIGGGDLKLYPEYDDASESQWYNACTSGGAHTYPYEGQFIGDACNDSDPLFEGYTPVGSLASCQSPEPSYRGVFDLSGNVGEWEDACEVVTKPGAHPDGRADRCRVRGGTASQSDDDVSCAADQISMRVTVGPGIRCCYP